MGLKLILNMREHVLLKSIASSVSESLLEMGEDQGLQKDR